MTEASTTRRSLRTLLFQNRRTMRDLEAEGVDRRELRAAVLAVHNAGQLVRGDDEYTKACLIAAELADNPAVALPRDINWDKIIEFIQKLMPLIETWMSMCIV